MTHPESDILEYKVKWALGSITMNKAIGGYGIPVKLFQILKDNAVKSAALSMPASLENSPVATGLEKVTFHSNPKERQYQRILKLPHNCTFQMFKLNLEKAEEPEIKLSTSVGSLEKQENSRKTSTSALLITPKPLTVWITTNWKILQEMGIPDHLTCLLRNPRAGQEVTVRIGHGTADWFQKGKGVYQGCMLSPCLFNLYAEYIIEMLGWMNCKLESRLPGGISITLDMHMIPPLWQKVKKN